MMNDARSPSLERAIKRDAQRTTAAACAVIFAVLLVALDVQAQTRRPGEGKATAAEKRAPEVAPAPLLRRVTTLRESRRFNYGGTVTIYGAPEGSLTVEGWGRNEVEIVADVELKAATEEDLARLAALNKFHLDADVNHLRLITVGVHDRAYLKRADPKLPKHLLSLPWKIDYRVRVPLAVDLEIYAGRGALTLAAVEGAVRLNAGEGAATLALAGGDVEATLAGGPVIVRVAARSWRGRGMNVRVARGDLLVELPANFNGDVNAEVLRAGRVENLHAGLEPRERTPSTDRTFHGRGGQGGAALSFIVGDGTLRITQDDGKHRAGAGAP